mmetsp:Transcript_11175/g.31444  ORF Transcript_11175/g.31444 Transcript_11175/m.31444 type:complete len:298 (+) Transcript_11175:416-1309(+)
MGLAAPDGLVEPPASLALGPLRRGDGHGHAEGLGRHGDGVIRSPRAVEAHLGPRDSQEPPQPVHVRIRQRADRLEALLETGRGQDGDVGVGLEGGPNLPCLPRLLKRQVDGLPQAEDLPEGEERSAELLAPAREGRAPACEEDARLRLGARERLPDVLGEVAEDGRHRPREVLREPAEHRLAAATAMAALVGNVEAVLGRVEIEGGQVLHELNECLGGAAEGVGAVGLSHLIESVLGLVDDVLVQKRQVGIGNAVLDRVEVIDVAQHEAASVAYFAGVLEHSGHDALTDGDVKREVN